MSVATRPVLRSGHSLELRLAEMTSFDPTETNRDTLNHDDLILACGALPPSDLGHTQWKMLRPAEKPLKTPQTHVVAGEQTSRHPNEKPMRSIEARG